MIRMDSRFRRNDGKRRMDGALPSPSHSDGEGPGVRPVPYTATTDSVSPAERACM